MLLHIERSGPTHRIHCRCDGFEAKVQMTRQSPHAIVLNVPFDESPTAFYYNHKVSCMTAGGWARVGEREFRFEEDAWGLLDWGRGVWPFHNEWYWSSASGRLLGEVFGFNLGCGFGNTAAAGENAVFYRDEIHKLGPVDITPGKPYTEDWTLADRAGRLALTLRPLYDRETKIKLLWVDNNTHQMFGRFSGRVTLESGQTLAVENITGFAEHAVNNW